MKLKSPNIICVTSCDSIESFDSQDNYNYLIVFQKPASIEANDSLIDASPSSVYLRTSGEPFSIKPVGSDTPLSYHYVAYKGSLAMKLTTSSNIEANVLLKPLQIHYSENIISKIRGEIDNENSNWESLCFAYILELLSKTFRLCNHDFVEALPDHSQNLRALRAEIHEKFSLPWKIDEMAKKMNLSTSRFASLYKSTFKISPTEDLIQTRIAQAKKMLSSSKVSVKKVSEACGFESVHYFHRAFKKRSNFTPKHYQNSKFADQGSIFTTERHFSLDRLTQQAEYSGIIEITQGELKFHGNAHHISKLLGYPDSELRERPFWEFVSPEYLEIVNASVLKILQNKNILDLNLNLRTRSGEDIPVLFSALLKGQNWFWFIKYQSVATR